MVLTASVLMLVLPVAAMNLDSLQGKWTASVRMDNLFRMNTHFSASVHADYYGDPYYGDADVSAHVYSEQSGSWGIPTEYSVLWRIRKDLAVGLDGEASYQKSPRGEYRYRGEDYEQRGEYSGTSWTGSLGLEVYKYFCRSLFISPFASISPFIARSHAESVEETTRFQDGQINGRYSTTRRNDTGRYGVSLNWGAEVFFRLSTAQMGLRMKSTLAKFWRHYYEYSRISEEEGNIRSDRVSEESPLGLELYLPLQGNFSLWLCFYF